MAVLPCMKLYSKVFGVSSYDLFIYLLPLYSLDIKFHTKHLGSVNSNYLFICSFQFALE